MPGVPNLGPAVNRRLWGLSGWSGLRPHHLGRRLPRLPPPARAAGPRRLERHRRPPLAARGTSASPPPPTSRPRTAGRTDYELVGFSNWSGPDDGRLPADVEEFLDAGDPPVIVTLGTSGARPGPSCSNGRPRRLDAEGARGLFLVSNPDERDPPSGRRASAATTAPGRSCRWRPCSPGPAAIVHSGAHGTNALALAAGVPSVVIPCLFDQLWHARRQAELGTGVWVRRPRRLGPAVPPPAADPVPAGRGPRSWPPPSGPQDGTATAADRIEAFLAAG